MIDNIEHQLEDGLNGDSFDQCDSNNHLALIYEEQRKQLDTVVPFIRQGLANGERCLYVADDNTKRDVLEALREGGIDIEAARDSGALSIHTKEDTYLRTGEFDSDAMIDFWKETLEEAQEHDAFEGVRAAVEMTWAIDTSTEYDTLVDYESALNSLYAGEDYTVLCQYNRTRFPPEVISDVIQAHPLLVRNGTISPNRYYRPPEELADEFSQPGTYRGTAAQSSNEHQPSDEVAPAAPSDTHPARVLYVAEEPSAAKAATRSLETKDGIDTVVTETDPYEALQQLTHGQFECIVSDYNTPEMDGIELLKAVREKYSDLPFILLTSRDSEELASETISSGVTDYIQKTSGSEQDIVLANRISNAVEHYRTERKIERTRRRYRRLIEASTDVVTVINEEGWLEYLSPAAEQRLGYPAAELIGANLFDYIHPEDREAVEDRFTTLVDEPLQRVPVRFRFEQRDGSWTWFEARARNLLDDADIEGIVVYARDITERVRREQTLQESENQFRSLFEEAFDAMVLADDEDTFVEVNPAACGLFELPREDLLGRSIADFAPSDYDFKSVWQTFQQSDLERRTLPLVTAEGTRRIVEIAVTPNVVEGQHLFVIRDVTDREEYERVLTKLHASARNLLGTETKSEIARSVVDTATDLLSMSVVSIYLFDPCEGLLDPSAVSRNTIDLESLESVAPTHDSIIGTTFLDGEPRALSSFDEVDTSLRSEVPIDSGLFLPLGEHGVCVIGDTDADLTDDDRELANILVAAAETALDRIDKESDLRERERELQDQNRTLERLNTFNRTLREIDQILMRVETREAIEQATCQHLSTSEGIAFVWFADYDSEAEQLVPREWSGTAGGSQYLDAISFTIDDKSSEPAKRAVTTGEPVYINHVTEGLHDDPWRKAALSNGFRSAISIPLTYKHISYGAITIYAEQPDFFGELLRMAVSDLGTNLAKAINSVEHQNALVSGSGTEIKVQLTDESFPPHSIASEADCSLTLEGVTPQSDGDVLKYLGVSGTDLHKVTAIAEEMAGIADATVVDDDGTDNLVRLRLSERSLIGHLADRGVRVLELNADADSAMILLFVPEAVEINWVFEAIRDRYSNPELVAKTQRGDIDVTSDQHSGENYRSKLTPRQQEVLRTAYHSGFFESPRECTGEELADELDISPQTFYRHIRKAERKLFDTVFQRG